jgi:hypothetical protein
MPEACGSVPAAVVVVVVAKFMLRTVSLSALVSCAACLSGMYNKARHSLSNMLRGLVQRKRGVKEVVKAIRKGQKGYELFFPLM